jgi:hypothetical protein
MFSVGPHQTTVGELLEAVFSVQSEQLLHDATMRSVFCEVCIKMIQAGIVTEQSQHIEAVCQCKEELWFC